jgi:hypothetical protein
LTLPQAAQIGSRGIVPSLAPSQNEEDSHVNKRKECDRHQGGNQAYTETTLSQ